MKKLITILFLFFSILGYSQTIEGVKHIEIVSEIQDTMALLNISSLKDDIIKDKDLLIDETKDALEAKYEDQKLETKKMRNKKLI